MRDGDYIGEWYLPVDDGSHRLYVLERGTGPVVLSIHGGPGHDHGYLRDALARLEEDYRVVYFDQRGSLRSPMPLERVGFDAIVNDLALLAAELGSSPVRLLAHSMGCVIAAAAVARHPERFAEVVLVNPGPLRARQPMFPPPPPRREVTEELARRGLDGELRSARETTWAWRIRFAGANLFHVERWTGPEVACSTTPPSEMRSSAVSLPTTTSSRRSKPTAMPSPCSSVTTTSSIREVSMRGRPLAGR